MVGLGYFYCFLLARLWWSLLRNFSNSSLLIFLPPSLSPSLPPSLLPHHPHRASDPEEIYKIHEKKQQLQRTQDRESQLDQLINICKQELNLLTENQENWQYPLQHIIPHSLCMV